MTRRDCCCGEKWQEWKKKCRKEAVIKHDDAVEKKHIPLEEEGRRNICVLISLRYILQYNFQLRWVRWSLMQFYPPFLARHLSREALFSCVSCEWNIVSEKMVMRLLSKSASSAFLVDYLHSWKEIHSNLRLWLETFKGCILCCTYFSICLWYMMMAGVKEPLYSFFLYSLILPFTSWFMHFVISFHELTAWLYFDSLVFKRSFSYHCYVRLSGCHPDF